MKCSWCGEKFIRKYNAEKYCSQNCRKEGNLEKKREMRIKLYNKYHRGKDKIQTYSQYKNDLGTGSLSAHPHTDYIKEYIVIQNEMKRHKLKT